MKKEVLKSMKICKKICKTSIKILRSATQIENVKFFRLDEMIAHIHMVSNKKNSKIGIELFIRRRKLNMSTSFITKSYFLEPKGC